MITLLAARRHRPRSSTTHPIVAANIPGRICLTNNAVERALRGIALGRKAWLFAGSDLGGERAAYENIRTAVSSGLGVGILPQSAISKDHVILDEEDGFPPLPDVHLVMIQASKTNAVRQMADFLRRSSGNKIGRNMVLI